MPTSRHDEKGRQGRHRQGHGDDERGAQIAEKQQEQEHDQNRGLDQGLPDRADRLVDEVRAIIEDFQRHAGREARFQLRQPIAHGLDDSAGVGAAQGDHQSFDCFADAVFRDGAIAGELADANRRHVANPQDAAVEVLQNDLFEILRLLNRAFRSHDQGLFAVAEPPGAVVAIIGGDGVDQVGDAHSGRGEKPRVGRDLEGADETAERVDVGDARNGAQGGTDRPVEQGAPLFQRKAAALDGEHENIG